MISTIHMSKFLNSFFPSVTPSHPSSLLFTLSHFLFSSYPLYFLLSLPLFIPPSSSFLFSTLLSSIPPPLYFPVRLFHTKGSPPRSQSKRQLQYPTDNCTLHTYDDEYYPDSDFYENPGPGSSPKRVYMSSDKYQKLVDRLSYEYKDRNKRREKEM